MTLQRPTALADPAAVLDTIVTAETPEGILIELRPAGITARFYAFILDLLIRGAALLVLWVMLSYMAGIGIAVYLISWFLLEWFYPVAFELSSSGATPGKRVLQLRTVMDNGLPITPAASITRNLLRAVDFLPLCYGAAFVTMLLRRDFKRLGDIAAATLVVHRQRPAAKIALSDLPPLAPAQPLAPRDQAAIMALAARASGLTRERLDELAALAAPISGDSGRSGPEVTRRVLAVSQWLLGRR
jgi:uncharacterized RDD family membrane protein YckC